MRWRRVVDFGVMFFPEHRNLPPISSNWQPVSTEPEWAVRNMSCALRVHTTAKSTHFFTQKHRLPAVSLDSVAPTVSPSEQSRGLLPSFPCPLRGVTCAWLRACVCVCARSRAGIFLSKLFEPFLTLLVLIRKLFVVHCKINPIYWTHLLSEIRTLKAHIVPGLVVGRLR